MSSARPGRSGVAAESPLHERMGFVVGARRSGTLWLQRIVAAHPRVSALPTETYLFSYGISQVFERIQHGYRGSQRVASVYAERGSVVAATRQLCDAIFAPFAEAGDALLLERTPWHARHLGLIGEIYPDARILHVIRDGRDVARSLVAQPWGPETIAEAAAEWRETVTVARRDAADNPRYREVRYERLLDEPAAEIEALYEWLALPDGSAALPQALRAAGERANEGADPARGKPRWLTDWGRAEMRQFDAEAGELLEELGYERVDARRRSRRRRGRERLATSGPPQPVPVAEHPRSTVLQRQQVLEQLVAALCARRPSELEQLLDEQAGVRILAEGNSEQAIGPEALALLTQALENDPAFAGRQLSGESFPGLPHTTIALCFELESGETANRFIAVRQQGDRISELTLFGGPAPRRPGG